ncbi:hypothetical protein GWI34_27815 [Actinomadura sp. DSM 109109]|nr:hypothetical protein [Actinomadura lepetitiana]
MTDGSSGLASYVRDWRPEPQTASDLVGPGPAAALAAVLDRPADAPPAGATLPPLWHWLYFLDWPAQADLGADGHPAHGPFLPPVPARTRMYAGGRLRVREPIEVGTPATRTSVVADVRVRQGRSGELLFVTVRHEIHQGGELRATEEQDLVYRSSAGAGPAAGPRPGEGSRGAGAATEPAGPWSLPLEAGPVLLFRFSALTANAHRIHYDETYARTEEGHRGLVVHGPLLAVLMAELPRRHAPRRRVGALAYRFRRPVFAGEPVLVTGRPDGGGARLAVTDASGTARAEATIEFE